MTRIAGYLLNIAYVAVLVVVSPLIVWAMVRKGKYRDGYGAKLFGRVPKRVGERRCIWFHAVSVGEVNVLRTLVESSRARRPEFEFAISTTTKSGFDLARKRFPRDIVFYCPLDFTWAVRAAMRRIRPSALVLAELELWPNLIRAAKERGASVAIVNGRVSDKSFRGYQRIRPFVASVLSQVGVIAAQDAATAERFQALGASPASVCVTGSLKYDGAETDRDNPRTNTLRALANLHDDDVILLAGSTQAPEESIVLSTFGELAAAHPALKLIIVPRHPERFQEVARLIRESGHACTRRTLLDDQARRSSCEQYDWRILLVDSVGELGAWWGAATIGFVGGSLGSRGGQNMIEPAAYGVATCFGPNTRNFRDIVAALLSAEAAVVVPDREGLTAFANRCITDAAYREQLGANASALVKSQLGATDRTLDLLAQLPALSRAMKTPKRDAA